MGIVTAINWLFNFIVSITWPELVNRFSPGGAFLWYAAWCVIGEIVILASACILATLKANCLLTTCRLVPETKGLTLEELSQVFKKTTKEHAGFGLLQAKAFFSWCIGRNSHFEMPAFLEKRPREIELPVLVYGEDPTGVRYE